VTVEAEDTDTIVWHSCLALAIRQRLTVTVDGDRYTVARRGKAVYACESLGELHGFLYGYHLSH